MHRNLLAPILQIPFFASYVLFMLNYIIELSCKIISWYNAMAFISKRMHTITIRWGHLLLFSEWNKYRIFRAALGGFWEIENSHGSNGLACQKSTMVALKSLYLFVKLVQTNINCRPLCLGKSKKTVNFVSSRLKT